ncbi:tetratricopeptide repeat protein [Azospirillum sp. sgz301742]
MRTILVEHLTRWADEKGSRDGLPELVHRLIRSTVRVRRLDLPTGDPTRYRGWDGLVEVEQGNAWVPAGHSAWEMGVNADPKGKADDDYAKRLKDPKGIDPAQSTFVFVTLRVWPGGRAWSAARRAEGVWKDVRVLDAGDLHQWLADSDRTSLWFAAVHLEWPEVGGEWIEPTIAWKPHVLKTARRPLSWLTWDARLTDLIGRDQEKADLLAWARGEPGAKFRVLAGEGGAGKTRLAHEVADELARDPNWSAGLVPADRPLPLDAGPAGCFLLIDYPEERRDAVQARLAQIAAIPYDPERRVRVLLLSRHGDDYWQPAITTARADAAWDPEYPLREGVAPADAWAIYQSALPRVPRTPGQREPQPVDAEAFGAWLGRVPVNQRPLLIAAAAIQAVSDPERRIVDLTARQVVEALAEREIVRLRKLAKQHGFADDALARLAALAAVRGHLDGSDLTRLADPALDLGLRGREELFDRVRATGCLTDDGLLPAPVPDIVAAALVVEVLAAQPHRAPEWLWAAIDGAEAIAIDRLGRLSYDAEVVLGRHDQRMSLWLEAMVKGRLERCRVLEPQFLDPVLPQGLLRLSAGVSLTLADQATDDGQKARFLTNASIDLAAVGDEKSALAAIREAVAVFRRLAAANPARFEADLATSLNTLSNGLSDAGDGTTALAAIREAVEIRRRLAAANPACFEVVLAQSLNNLSNRLSDAGDGAAALAAIREAVAVYRRLAAANPARFEAGLALCLWTLSNGLSDAGEGATALAAIREVVAVYRRLAAANPARFEADLAQSLNNLSNRLSDAGDGAAALAAICEAVVVFRRLAAANPARFEAGLARCLWTLSNRLQEAGEREKALHALEEAIQLIGPAAALFPDGDAARRLRGMRSALELLTAAEEPSGADV